MNQRSIAVALFSVALLLPGLFALYGFVASFETLPPMSYQPTTHATPIDWPSSPTMPPSSMLFVPAGTPQSAPYLNWQARTLRQFTLATPWPTTEIAEDGK